MCEPTTIMAAQFAISAASAGAGLVGQIMTSKQQASAIEAQAEATRQAAIANYDQLEMRRQEEQAAAGQQAETTQRDTLKAVGLANAAAGEAGVTGLSVDALIADLYGQSARFNDGVTQNLDMTERSIDTAKENVRRGAASQINSLPSPERPDFLGAGLRIADAGMNYYQARYG